MLECFQRVCLSFNMKTYLKEVCYSEMKDICREIKTFEFIAISYESQAIFFSQSAPA